MALPIAFMVMPFGKKPTGATDRLPTEIDFDALWAKVYEPVLSAMGYTPVRADRDVGALIITEMVQRLALADLVVADVTLPNANVYYEIGVRHAARSHGCVLTAVHGAATTFDVDQMRRVTYPLADGAVGDGDAASARAALQEGLGSLTGGISPVFAAVPGFPDDIDPARLSAFETFVAELSAFQAAARAAREAPKAERRARVEELVARHGGSGPVLESVALELLRLLRDLVGWKEMADYAATLPDHVQRHPLVKEQQYLAMAKTGDVAAVGLLEQLILDLGETSERRGLLGGRYKTLCAEATSPAEKARYLDKAIEQYHLGMQADLNDYYPASNLPRLYRQRNEGDDEQKAAEAATITLAACRRAMARAADDGWVRPTLLGMAFYAGNVAEARRLLPEIRKAGPAAWQLKTTIADLQLSVEQQADSEGKAGLAEILAKLEALLD